MNLCHHQETLVQPTKVAAEFSQHAVWVGGGHLGEARQNQNVAVLQGALVHRLTDEKKRDFKISTVNVFQ